MEISKKCAFVVRRLYAHLSDTSVFLDLTLLGDSERLAFGVLRIFLAGDFATTNGSSSDSWAADLCDLFLPTLKKRQQYIWQLSKQIHMFQPLLGLLLAFYSC
jgi:hypothetical protein